MRLYFQLFNTWLYRLKSKHVLPPPSPSVNVEPPSAFIAIKETHFELVGHHLHRSAVHTSACLGTSFWSHCFLWSNISIMQKQILSPTWWAIGVSRELNLHTYWEHPSGTVHKSNLNLPKIRMFPLLTQLLGWRGARLPYFTGIIASYCHILYLVNFFGSHQATKWHWSGWTIPGNMWRLKSKKQRNIYKHDRGKAT